MIVSVGCDIVRTSRIEALLASETAVRRAFHPGELRRNDPLHAAGILAAKEAVIKAYGLPAGSWLSIEIAHKESGKPTLQVDPASHTKQIASVDLSISHDGAYAVAFVVLLEKEVKEVE
jgi:holo-[acyl-carrier protein] synthase